MTLYFSLSVGRIIGIRKGEIDMSKRYIFGFFLILLGGGFLLEQFNLISFSEVAGLYWPIILIVIGLVGLFDKESSKFVNLILILVGTALQINNLDIIEIDVFQLIWPIILILVGLMIIFSRQKNKEYGSSNINNKNILSQDTIDEFVVMGGIETNNQSENFKGGRITVIMGGVELDLRGASLHNNEAFLEIKTFMGGVEVTVPLDWRVEIKGTPILGGWSNKTRNNDLNAPLLKIDALSMFGGIEIK